MIIGVDFDGTIVEHDFPDIGPAVPGALEWMKKWQEAGAKLMLWTMRSPPVRATSHGRPVLIEHGHPVRQGESGRQVLDEAVEYCRQGGVEFWAVNRNPDQAGWSQSHKQYAHVYVDDAALGCPLLKGTLPGGRKMVDWSVVGPAVLRMIQDAKNSAA
jgi:hypothetical protein